MLILASASNARHRLLTQARIPHKIIVSDFDESSIKEKSPKKLVQILAEAKARSVESIFLKDSKINPPTKKSTAILGCDSIFEFEGEALGKPKNKEEAIKRLRILSSKSGILHTGHTLLIDANIKENKRLFKPKFNKIISCAISTSIKFSSFSIQEIEIYVKSEEPLFCAGGFTLEGEGSKFIESINGCYSNVIGLSLPWIRKKINENNI